MRNYDFDPRYFDGRLTYTKYCKPVISMQDSAWGVLDGMNADGLAVALAFGGRQDTGVGFGIPLVLRYVLETCSTTAEACRTLSRIPVHMSYSVMVIDAAGHVATVFMNPDRAAEVVSATRITNHQHQVEWDEHAAFTRTRERLDMLDRLLNVDGITREALLQRMLKTPLRSQQFMRGFGTLYTSMYDVAAGAMKVVWPDRRVAASFDRFEEQEAHVVLLRPVGRYMAK
jgi:predicted choloylglycine hydrolase